MTHDWWAEQEIFGAVVTSTDEGMKFAFVCAATEESPYWDSVTEEAAEATWDEWIARVRRDAARAALDGYADALNRNRSAAVWEWPEFVADVREWAAYNYPEETP